MSYANQIFEMLDVRCDEEFMLDSNTYYIYKMDETLHLRIRENEPYSQWRCTGSEYLYWILNGRSKITKIPNLTTKDKIAIDYAKACGCNWLARDRDGSINGFLSEPNKFMRDYNWTNYKDYVSIFYNLSFLSWDDEKAYHIGN